MRALGNGVGENAGWGIQNNDGAPSSRIVKELKLQDESLKITSMQKRQTRLNTTPNFSGVTHLLALALMSAAGIAVAAEPQSLFPGDSLTIRLNQELNSGKNQAGTRFLGVVETPVLYNGVEIVPRGAQAEGYIREASTSGRLAGRSELHLHLDGLIVRGKRYSITTQREVRLGQGHMKRNAVLVGGGALLGTVVGAIAGGGKGATIGAASGAAAGGAGAVATGKKEILIPAETVMTFRVRDQLILD